MPPTHRWIRALGGVEHFGSTRGFGKKAKAEKVVKAEKAKAEKAKAEKAEKAKEENVKVGAKKPECAADWTCSRLFRLPFLYLLHLVFERS